MSLWKKNLTLEQLNQLCRKTAIEHMGITFTEIAEEFLKAQMPVDHRTIQPAGLMHGGAFVLLAESLGGLASSLCLDKPTDLPVGIEINANHIKSAKEGFVTGTVKPIHIGRSIHLWEIRIENEKNQLCSIARLTNQIISKT